MLRLCFATRRRHHAIASVRRWYARIPAKLQLAAHARCEREHGCRAYMTPTPSKREAPDSRHESNCCARQVRIRQAKCLNAGAKSANDGASPPITTVSQREFGQILKIYRYMLGPLR